MLCLHDYGFSRLKHLFALALISSLVACSGGGSTGIPGGSSSNSSGSTSEPSGSLSKLSLSWVAPSEREDDTGLSLSEITGYRIYYGTETRNYQNQFNVDDSSAEQAQIVDIPKGVYYLVMTTIDSDGRESSYSSEVVITV
jgi:hypothetical protein